ncbi:uncharacterized protein J3D65DRAFT_633523, partial [Phyllosticta citribraziliensis]
MLPLSHARLPTRWRLALATARRRGASATRATFSTTAATAFPIHPTTTRLQLQTSAALSQPLSPVSGSYRSFSHTARWQDLVYEKIKAKKAAKAKWKAIKDAKAQDKQKPKVPVSGPSEEGEPAKVEEPENPKQSEKDTPDKPKEPEKSDKSERLGRKPVPGPKLAAMKRKKVATDRHVADEGLEKLLLGVSSEPLLSPADVEKIEKAVLEEILAKKAKKQTKQQDMKKPVVKKPDIIPFGPFEDVIQPLALTLWGGKAEENQNAPKLRYTMNFLGPTCFWRVQIRSTRPKSENDMWKLLWKCTRPGYAPPSEKERAVWARDARKMLRRSQHERAGLPQKGQEIGDKESYRPEQGDGPTGKAPPLKAKENDPMEKAPPLEAVVQDLYKRQLARIAYEKASQQRELEARNRALQKLNKEGEDEDPPSLLPLSYTYQDPHKERLPFEKRNSMRHIDICGPIPPYVREKQDKKTYIWTDMGGNVLANTFELEKIYSTGMHDGVNVWVWRGEYVIREMQAFMCPGWRPRLERIKEEEKEIRNRVLGRKPPPPKSAFVLRNDKERYAQLKRKSHVLRQIDGGWKKILEIAEYEKSDKGFKLPPYGHDGKILFSEATPHPDRATIDAVWEPRIAVLRNADAIADYNAFLRRRMEAGILPAETTPKDSKAGEIVRGWTNPTKRKKSHPGDVAKKRKADERDQLRPMNFASLQNDGFWEEHTGEKPELSGRKGAVNGAKWKVRKWENKFKGNAEDFGEVEEDRSC